MKQSPLAKPVTKIRVTPSQIDRIGTSLREAYQADSVTDAEFTALLEKLDPKAVSDRG